MIKRILISKEELEAYQKKLCGSKIAIDFGKDIDVPTTPQELQTHIFMAGYITAFKSIFNPVNNEKN